MAERLIASAAKTGDWVFLQVSVRRSLTSATDLILVIIRPVSSRVMLSSYLGDCESG